VDTDLHKAQQKKLKTESEILLKTKGSIHSNSFLSFWSRVFFSILAIFATSLIIGKTFSVELGFITAIILLISWLIFQYWELQKIAKWINNPTKKNYHGSIGIYDLIHAEITRLIRSVTHQQETLNKKLAGFKRSTEAMPDGVVIIDNNNQIVFATPKAESYLSIRSDYDLGKNIINIIRNPSFDEFLQKKDWSESIILENLPVENRVIELQILPYDENERLLICRDITKLKRLESSKKDFVANVSHELKTPLTILSGFIETMIEVPLDKKKTQSMLKEMSQQTCRMENLVRDLLVLSRLDTQQISATHIEVDLESLFCKMLEVTLQISKNRHQVTLNNEKKFNLLGNYEQVFSAFWNLINNSITYTEPGGEIQISWQVNTNQEGIFKVTDTGPGIEAHHLPFISERFYRVEKSRSQKSGGTGLGLSIVKNIALKHESKLKIESKIGKGSTFKIIFPSERIKKINEKHEKDSNK